MAPLVRIGGSRHTGLAALPHRNIQELSVITDPADETSLRKISFAEISLPIKQEPVRNGFQPDIIIRKGSVSVEISNSVSAELLSRIGEIFHAE